MTGSQPSKEKIIFAAVDLIERNGLHKLTMRSISKQAGVNVAAINYYFGSKEILIDEALKLTLKNAFIDPVDELKTAEHTVYSALEKILCEWFEGVIKYPGISKAHIYEPLINNKYEGLFTGELRNFLNRVYGFLKPLAKGTKGEILKIAITQMISAVVFTGLMPDLYRGFLTLDFQKPGDRRKYIKILLDSYFGNYK